VPTRKPIFYDPAQRRWTRLRRVMDLSGVLITVVIVVFLFTAFRDASLGKVLLPEPRHPYRALREKEKSSNLLSKKPHIRKKAGGKSTTSSGVGVDGSGPRAAFYVSWDAGSLASLREYHAQIDLLFPEWLHVLSSDGHMQAATPENKMFDVVEAGVVHPPDEKVMPLLKAAKSPLQVMPLVNNFDPVASKWLNNVGDFLNNPDGRNRFRNEMDLLLASDKYAGLCVDFEEI
jgi:peptidoglycan-N-acetylglucosamine deacetylase